MCSASNRSGSLVIRIRNELTKPKKDSAISQCLILRQGHKGPWLGPWSMVDGVQGFRKRPLLLRAENKDFAVRCGNLK